MDPHGSQRPDRLDRALVYDLFYGGDPAPIFDFMTRWAGAGPFQVLDVGCGTGRMLRPMNEHGWKAVGLEPDPVFQAAARRRGFDVHLGGFLDIDYDREFDLIVAVNDPLQYVLSIELRLQALSRVHDALRPNGRFLVDIANFLWIVRNYRAPQDLTKQYAGWSISRHVQHDVDVHDQIWTHTDEFTAKKRGEEWADQQVHRLSMFGFPELDWALHASGFRHLQSWHGYDAVQPGPCHGSRILVTCHKPG